MKTSEKEGLKTIFSNPASNTMSKSNTKMNKSTKTTEKKLDKCLAEINLKLNNVLTKDDDAFLNFFYQKYYPRNEKRNTYFCHTQN